MSDRRTRDEETSPSLGRGAALGGLVVLPLLIAIGYSIVSRQEGSRALIAARTKLSEVDADRRSRLLADAGRQSELLERLFALQRSERELAARLSRAMPLPASLERPTSPLSDSERGRMEELLAERDPVREARTIVTEVLQSNPPDPEPAEFASTEAALLLREDETTRTAARAAELLQTASERDPEDPVVRRGLGVALMRAGDLAGATSAFHTATDLAVKQFGPKSAEAAQAMFLEAEAMRRSGADRRDVTVLVERALGIVEPRWTEESLAMSRRYEDLGDLDRALAFSSPTLELTASRGGDSDLLTAKAAEALGRQYQAKGLYESAEPLMRRALAVRERILGGESPEVADSMLAIARLLMHTDRTNDADRYLTAALEVRKKSDGARSAAVADILFEQGELKRRTSHFAEAERIHKQALDLREALTGGNTAEVALSLETLAIIAGEGERAEEAEVLYRRALSIRENLSGPSSAEALAVIDPLVSILLKAGRSADAEPFLKRQLAAQEAEVGSDDPAVAAKLNSIADIALRSDRVSDAEPLLRRALAILERAHGPESPEIAQTLNNLGYACHVAGRTGEAGRLWKRALAIRQKAQGNDHPDLAVSFANLGFLAEDEGNYAGAAILYRRAIDLQTRSLGEGHPNNPRTIQDMFAAVAHGIETPRDARNLLRLAVYCERIAEVPESISAADVKKLLIEPDRARVEALLAFQPPRRDLAGRLVLRLAALAKLLEMPSRDPFRVDFLDKRIASLGLEGQVGELERRIGVTRVQVWSDPAYPVVVPRLNTYLLDMIRPINWKAELTDIGGWDLASLEPTGAELKRLVDEELARLDAPLAATPTPTPAAAATAIPAPLPRPSATTIELPKTPAAKPQKTPSPFDEG